MTDSIFFSFIIITSLRRCCELRVRLRCIFYLFYFFNNFFEHVRSPFALSYVSLPILCTKAVKSENYSRNLRFPTLHFVRPRDPITSSNDNAHPIITRSWYGSPCNIVNYVHGNTERLFKEWSVRLIFDRHPPNFVF